jgi:type I restriction enzyme, S subunit
MEGWKESYLGNIAKIIMGQSPDSKFYNSEGKGKIFLQGCSEFGKYVPNSTVYSLDIKKIAPSKSILFSVRAPVGKINYAEKEYCIGRGIASISSTTIDTNYLYYFLTFIENNNVYKSQGSTFDSINYDQLKSIAISYPQSKTEQRKIAEILSKVDKAIAQTEKLIAKYKRIKTGMMQDLLTKGIDENGNIRSEETHEFKDSSLGRIPVEWEVNTVLQLAFAIKVGIVIKPAQYYVAQGVPMLRSFNIKETGIDLRNIVYMTPEANEQNSKSVLKKGDVVSVRTGNPGTSAIVTDEYDGINCIDLVITKPNLEVLLSEFLVMWINSEGGQWQIKKHQGGIAQQHFNVADMEKLLIPKMNIDEQKIILEKMKSIEKSISQQKFTFSKFKKLKTALMQDLLTGKVRVTDEMNCIKTRGKK